VNGLANLNLLSNDLILVADQSPCRLLIFALPEFSNVQNFDQPLPADFAIPLWQYDGEQLGFHSWNMLTLLPLPLRDSDKLGIMLISPYQPLYIRAILGQDGLKFFEPEGLPFTSRILCGRTRALVARALGHPDGFYIECFSYATKLDQNGPMFQSHGAFTVLKRKIPLLDDPHRPLDRFQDDYVKVFFDEESGRTCFWLKNPDFSTSPEFDIVVVDLV
ncbi:hypothetical protein FRC01_002299, partial [Tulasnella sp. 417]